MWDWKSYGRRKMLIGYIDQGKKVENKLD